MGSTLEAVVSSMFEVYYAAQTDPVREARLLDAIRGSGGKLVYREAPDANGARTICLTFEFDDWGRAKEAAEQVRALGEHVEGPGDYA